jgi:uncharacterized membrane protein YdcZ (DUF606 family)
MSLYVLSLILTAAVLHAFWNLLSKKANNNKRRLIAAMLILAGIIALSFN